MKRLWNSIFNEIHWITISVSISYPVGCVFCCLSLILWFFDMVEKQTDMFIIISSNLWGSQGMNLKLLSECILFWCCGTTSTNKQTCTYNCSCSENTCCCISSSDGWYLHILLLEALVCHFNLRSLLSVKYCSSIQLSIHEWWIGMTAVAFQIFSNKIYFHFENYTFITHA